MANVSKRYSSVFSREGNRLIWHFDSEHLWIEPWGQDSLRVRGTRRHRMEPENWALLDVDACDAEITIEKDHASIRNGRITARVSAPGKLTLYNAEGKVLLDEYLRNREDVTADYCSALDIAARDLRPVLGGEYELFMRFESDPEERIYGMGQYQMPYLDLKGCDLELAHRNSQASVPFYVSSLGYGFLWNNPSVGEVHFGRNITKWVARSTKQLDYWVTAGDTPDEIMTHYALVTGTVPMMPDYGMGFWQCKLRYQTQEELLHIAREYKRRGIPVSVIVVDFFHWPQQGDWMFDKTYWPDPDAMIAELKEMGIELMVSIWPTVDNQSVHYEEMLAKGYLIRTDRGMRASMDFVQDTIHFDPTNPEARKYVWNCAKENYYDKGIRVFWLDEAEPEYKVYDFDLYRYYLGSDLEIGNTYPMFYAKTFFDGMRAEGQEKIVNLLRCAWAGSQRYGALVWSGDIHSSFKSLRSQFAAGLNMGMAGIPWWTTDIGGFHGGDPKDPAFRELLVRWFQWGTFCPVMRLHGMREPELPPMGMVGGAACSSGSDNEVWSFGEENYPILTGCITLRERMRPYITRLMKEAHETGRPVMRTLFYEFPGDPEAWKTEDQFMFGDAVLVAPILYAGQTGREVYLPAGAVWRDIHSGQVYEGGCRIKAAAPIEYIPVFERVGAEKGFEF